MVNEKKSFMDKLMMKIDAIAGPMTKFGQLPFVKAIVNGMVAAVGVTMVGSLFLVVFLLCSDGGLTKTALIPFMKPLAGQLALVNSLSMGIMAIYMVIAMGAEYADTKGINKTTGAVGAFFAFILLNYNTVGQLYNAAIKDPTQYVSALPINYWGGAGVITAIIAAAISVNILDVCYRYNIRIKLPDSVPPAISDSFSAIIPYFFTTLVCWGLRTLLNVNIPELIGQVLLPIFAAADNIFVFTLAHFLISAFWIVGLHGDNIVGAVTNAFTNTWLVENNAAFMAHQSIPHIWVPNLNRLFMWVSTCWPILFYMFKSSKKLPHLKPLATISLPPAIFCIIEPIMFGLPIVLNPFLAIPFIITHTITGALTYGLTAIGFIGRMYVNLPWATPSPILGFLGTGGSIGGVIVVVINFIIGLLIFYPFWKAYEKSELQRIEEENVV
ncbi:PTS system, lactose/cellobiose family IIC component [Eggerthia catenaformis OT 569 = DSM 20559]|uniref:Permease IIC component n=1 Tax=Eggerthia catenaformis OT 569 = DSM 20559 TaxID=999415 RepID=M2NGR5_9FIRM|nr:PTS transporter subunit EIIC [Eggerthia catenaformis]EMD17418.1 PTS system, lactose/cellobiose family IIC component [Eggerthia catenaformis OT 569 = DSM 20559]OUC52107.1 PTS lactose transporter subunit IIC [Eggerthia catenaformis]